MGARPKSNAPRLLRRSAWRAAFRGPLLLLRSLKAWRLGDDAAALCAFKAFLELDPNPAAEHMAFYGSLLVLNHRSDEAAAVYADVLKGKYSPLRWPTRSNYARAYAHYYLALIHKRPDALRLWLDAQRQRPAKGFGATYLPLTNSPMDAG